MEVAAVPNVIEFESAVDGSGRIQIPPDVSALVPPGRTMTVALRWGADEDAEWRAAGRRAFESAYAPEDAVYEQLIDATPAR